MSLINETFNEKLNINEFQYAIFMQITYSILEILMISKAFIMQQRCFEKNLIKNIVDASR